MHNVGLFIDVFDGVNPMAGGVFIIPVCVVPVLACSSFGLLAFRGGVGPFIVVLDGIGMLVV